MSFHDIIGLIQAIVWPIVVIGLAVLFRQELPALVQALAGRISRFSAAGVAIDFVLAQPPAQTLLVQLDDIREPTSTGFPPQSSAARDLLAMAKESRPADYIEIDLRDGRAWLTSRLYLFGVVLASLLTLRCFVFLSTRSTVPRYFLGLASAESVIRVLETRYPWLREVKVETKLEEPLNHLKQAMRTNSAGAEEKDQSVTELIRAFGDPVNSLGSKTVESFVEGFLNSPKLRREHDGESRDSEWVNLDTSDEHARWIADERALLDILGDCVRREAVTIDQTADDETTVRTVARKQGDFVALIDPEGRFLRLVDRSALVEKIVAGVTIPTTKR